MDSDQSLIPTTMATISLPTVALYLALCRAKADQRDANHANLDNIA